MKKSNSNLLLPALEQHKTGVHIFRWDFEEVTRVNPEGEEEHTFDYYEIWVENGSEDKTKEAVINALWGNGREQKLTNDYLAAKEGLFEGERASKAIDDYRTFLQEREAVKAAVFAAYNQ